MTSGATPQNVGVLWEFSGEEWPDGGCVHGSGLDVFAVPPRLGESRLQQRQADRLTQLGRALRELGIGSILAYSPQTKGRIERSFLTAQGRLVKHLLWRKFPPWKEPTHFWSRSIGRSGTPISPDQAMLKP